MQTFAMDYSTEEIHKDWWKERWDRLTNFLEENRCPEHTHRESSK